MAPMSTTLAPSRITARDPKGLKFMSIVEAAYNKASLSSEDEAQRVNDTSGLADLIGNFISEARLTDKYKREEVKSNYGYLSGYKPKDLVEQVNILREYWPDVCRGGVGHSFKDLPNGAEGLFAIPRWEKIATTYNEAVQIVLD